MRPGGRIMRISASAVVVLPEPDSPTRPTRSPASTSKQTSRTAWTTLVAVKKSMLRFWTVSSGMSGSPPQTRIGELVEPRIDQIKSDEQHDQDDHRGQDPPPQPAQER